MLKLSVLALFVIPTLSWAFTGKFSGQGQASYSSGRTYQCSEIFLHFQVTESELKLNEGGYICGFLQAGFDQFTMEIRAGELWHKDQYLGTMSPDKITYQIFDPRDESTYFFTLTKKDSHYHYFEEWHDGEKIALKVEGHLLPRD